MVPQIKLNPHRTENPGKCAFAGGDSERPLLLAIDSDATDAAAESVQGFAHNVRIDARLLAPRKVTFRDGGALVDVGDDEPGLT
jgi:hypothetical protein